MTPKPERTCFSWTLDSISRKVSIVFVLLGFVLDRRIWWIEHHVERRSTQQDVFATVKCTVESLKWSLQMHNCTVENCISRLKLGIEIFQNIILTIPTPQLVWPDEMKLTSGWHIMLTACTSQLQPRTYILVYWLWMCKCIAKDVQVRRCVRRRYRN